MKTVSVPPNITIPDLPNFTNYFINVYQLTKNFYGLKDASKTWYIFPSKRILHHGWEN